MTTHRKDPSEVDVSAPLVKTLVVRVFWGKRRESKERCAERLADCLSKLGMVSPFLETWRALGRSRSGARAEIETTASALVRRLRQNYDEGRPRKPILSLGVSFGAWTGEFKGGPSANISVHCGSYDPTSSNYAILSITCEGSWSRVSASMILALLDVLIGTWDPERGTAGFGLFHDLPPELDLDWIVYLDASHKPPSFPEPTKVETLSDRRGSIITLAPEPPDLRRPDEAKFVENVRQRLHAVR